MHQQIPPADGRMADYFDARPGSWPRQQQQLHQQQQPAARRTMERSAIDSWVEIDSQPSSSSVSSANEDIVTTGLRVTGQPAAGAGPRRRRLSQQPLHPMHQPNARARAAAAAARRGDETESEDDHHIGSSAENVHVEMPRPGAMATATATASSPPVVVSDADADADDDSDDDDRATALGRPGTAVPAAASPPPFRPAPNAFSHPHGNLEHRHSLPSSASPYETLPRQRRPSDSRFQRRSVPDGAAYRDAARPGGDDNDAVLRASLTTLLSYATAARGLGKPRGSEGSPRNAAGAAAPRNATTTTPGSSSSNLFPPFAPTRRPPVRSMTTADVTVVGPSSQPVELALVPESEIPDVGEAMPARTVPNVAGPHSSSGNTLRPRPAPQKHSTSPAHTTATTPSAATTPSEAAAPARRRRRSPSSASSPSRRRSRTAATTTTPTTVSAAAAKKKRVALLGCGSAAFISPTVLTWVVGASVVVFFSVVGFGAGYVIGREAGRNDVFAGGVGVPASSGGTAAAAARAAAESASSCGRQAAVSLGTGSGGLRKLKWGGALVASSVVA